MPEVYGIVRIHVIWYARDLQSSDMTAIMKCPHIIVVRNRYQWILMHSSGHLPSPRAPIISVLLIFHLPMTIYCGREENGLPGTRERLQSAWFCRTVLSISYRIRILKERFCTGTTVTMSSTKCSIRSESGWQTTPASRP